MATEQQVKKVKAQSFDKSEYQNNLKDFKESGKWILIGELMERFICQDIL